MHTLSSSLFCTTLVFYYISHNVISPKCVTPLCKVKVSIDFVMMDHSRTDSHLIPQFDQNNFDFVIYDTQKNSLQGKTQWAYSFWPLRWSYRLCDVYRLIVSFTGMSEITRSIMIRVLGKFVQPIKNHIPTMWPKQSHVLFTCSSMGITIEIT